MTAAARRIAPKTALDDLPRPPCAELLGWHVIDADLEAGWIRVGFEGRREFLNPAGHIQGGFLAAMLDDAMGPAVFAMTRGETYTVTMDMNVSYLAPALPGPLVAEGRVVQLGRSVGFLEAALMDREGKIVARATATARLVAAAKAVSRGAAA
ncbi:MAG: PaaI family thioesterase [Pseudomonadota bacterium]